MNKTHLPTFSTTDCIRTANTTGVASSDIALDVDTITKFGILVRAHLLLAGGADIVITQRYDDASEILPTKYILSNGISAGVSTSL